VCLAAVFFVVGSQPLSSWLVLTLVDEGVTRGAAGLVSAAGTGIGAVAMVLAARRADRSGPGRRARTAAVVASVMTVGLALFWCGTQGSLALVVLGTVLGLPAAMAGAGFAHAVAVDRAPFSVGRATAVMSGGYYLAALASPVSFGAVADLTGRYDVSWLIAVAGSGLCVASYLVVQRRVRPAAYPAGGP